jgi:hypothetical protein
MGMRQATQRTLTEVDTMPLMTMAEYARRRGVTRQAISRFVRDWQIARLGPRGLIDAGQPQLRTRDASGRRWSPPR